MRLSWRAVRCAAGRGVLYIGEAPAAQIAAVEAAKRAEVQGMDWGESLLENGQKARVRFLRVSGEGWVRTMPAPGGDPGKGGQTPVVLVLTVGPEEAGRAVEALARARKGPALFILAMGAGAAEEQRLREAATSAAPGPAGLLRALCTGEPPPGKLTAPPGVLT